MFWADHIDSVCKKINQSMYLIRRVRNLLPLQARVTQYNTLILPLFDYGDFIWGEQERSNHNFRTAGTSEQCLLLKFCWGFQSEAQALKSLDFKPIISRRLFYSCTAIVFNWDNEINLAAKDCNTLSCKFKATHVGDFYLGGFH